MYWANFLHIYQPPTQTEEIVRKVTEECYRRLVSVLENEPQGKITLNISAVLTQQLDRYGYSDVIEGLGRLAEKGQIEFTGSAMYHPILPLIPEGEMFRQIELNTRINKHYFGDVYDPQGFFPPEMCYSFDVAKAAAKFGFSWILVDEISFWGNIGAVRDDTIYQIDKLESFGVFFKERPLSAELTYGKYPSAQPFLKALDKKFGRHCYLLTGTDGEIYGHHRPGQEKLLEEVFAQGTPQTCTVSELFQLFHRVERIAPLPSSWSTWEDEMAQGIPYPQWLYPGHEIHRLQWCLTNLAIEFIHQVPDNLEGYQQARHLLDEGLHSCQYWWASCRPWWDTGMIVAGAQKLHDAIRRIQEGLSQEQVEEAESLFNSVVETAKRWQETGEAQAMKQKYLEEHKEVTSELTFGQQ
jgi:alpha-amylase/alpha-mannosidase (GH57 family)